QVSFSTQFVECVFRFDGSPAARLRQLSAAVANWREGNGVSHAEFRFVLADGCVPGGHDGVLFLSAQHGSERLACQRGDFFAGRAVQRREFQHNDDRIARERHDVAADARHRVGLVPERNPEPADFQRAAGGCDSRAFLPPARVEFLQRGFVSGASTPEPGETGEPAAAMAKTVLVFRASRSVRSDAAVLWDYYAPGGDVRA